MVIYSGISHWKWWFSIAMLNYQRVSDSDSYGNGKHSNHPAGLEIDGNWIWWIQWFLNSGDRANHVFCHVFCCVFSWRCGSITGCFEILCENYLVFWIKCIPKNDSFREPSWPETWIVFFFGCKSNRTYSSVAWRMCAAANDVISPPHPPQGKPHKTHKTIQTHVGFSTRRLNHPLKWTISIHFP